MPRDRLLAAQTRVADLDRHELAPGRSRGTPVRRGSSRPRYRPRACRGRRAGSPATGGRPRRRVHGKIEFRAAAERGVLAFVAVVGQRLSRRSGRRLRRCRRRRASAGRRGTPHSRRSAPDPRTRPRPSSVVPAGLADRLGQLSAAGGRGCWLSQAAICRRNCSSAAPCWASNFSRRSFFRRSIRSRGKKSKPRFSPRGTRDPFGATPWQFELPAAQALERVPVRFPHLARVHVAAAGAVDQVDDLGSAVGRDLKPAAPGSTPVSRIATTTPRPS